MGPTLRVEPIRAGEELRRVAKRSPSMRFETDTPTHPGLNPESVGELLTRPVREHWLPSGGLMSTKLQFRIHKALSDIASAFSFASEVHLLASSPPDGASSAM